MATLSKKVKAWVVVSIIWFLLVIAFAGSGSQYRADPYSFGNTESGFDIGEFLSVAIVFNIPLVIGWGIWWVKRD